MSRYSHSFYAPYVPVAQRRADGVKALEKLRKKGMTIEPVTVSSHGRQKIANSFWGNAWCKHLEAFSDYENRLPRGRTYIRNGSVLHLAIAPGEIKALVQGTSLYEETITIKPLPKTKWQAIQKRCQGGIGSLIELLQGKISDEIMAIVTDPHEGLFPRPSEIKLQCSCPDWATMCKHVAAVLYGVGARLDTQPELLFNLRGVDHNDLIAINAPAVTLGSSGPASRRRTLDTSTLDDVFGIELEPAAAPTARARRQSQTPIARKGTKKTAAKTAAKPTKAAAGKAAGKAAAKAVMVRPFKPTSASILKLRTKLTMTRSSFARQVQVTPQTIANWELRGVPQSFAPGPLARLQALHEKAARQG